MAHILQTYRPRLTILTQIAKPLIISAATSQFYRPRFYTPTTPEKPQTGFSVSFASEIIWTDPETSHNDKVEADEKIEGSLGTESAVIPTNLNGDTTSRRFKAVSGQRSHAGPSEGTSRVKRSRTSPKSVKPVHDPLSKNRLRQGEQKKVSYSTEDEEIERIVADEDEFTAKQQSQEAQQYSLPPRGKKESWQIQKEALKNKFKDGWNPRKKLSPDTMEGIRALHEQYPDKYTTPVLAEEFKVSAEAIRRILKSKWKPSPEQAEEKKARWAQRHDRIWDQKSELGLRPKRTRERGPEDPDSFEEDLRARQILANQ